MTAELELQRSIGRIEGRLDALEVSIEKLGISVEVMNRHMGQMQSVISETRGGWKVIVVIGSVAGALGAFVSKLIPFLTWRG